MLKKSCLLFLIIIFVVSPTNAQADPGFGTGVVLLNPPEEGLFFAGEIAPDGQFVVGTRIFDMTVHEDTHLHLWDLREIDRSGSGTEAQPRVSFDMSPYVGTIFDQGHIAFSPDSRKLAILSGQAVLLLSIPEFELLESIPVAGRDKPLSEGNIAWSSDGRLLAVSDAVGLMVWDGSKSYYAANEAGGSRAMFYFVDGWLVDHETSFSFCAALLQSCESYTFDGVVEPIYNVGQMLITDSQTLPTLAWTRDTQAVFHASSTHYAYVEGSLSSLSPDGRYSFIMRWTEGGSPDYPYYTLYDGQTELYEIGLQGRPIWLGTSDYFVQGNSLYHPGSAEPVDRLDDFHIEGIIDETEFGIWPEYLGGESVSDDGRWYMQILGATALVVPVNLDS